MKKKILLILGIILFIIPFVFNIYSIFRLISLAIGILLITLSFLYTEKRNIFLIILLPLILLLFSYGLDTIIFSKFNRIPIYIYEIKSSDKVSVYNSFFYRVYNCNNDLVLDYGYNKAYACDSNDLTEVSVNTVLSDPYESFKNYDNKFIKVNGKISKISGIDTIELSFYEKSEDTLNGNVKFNSANVIRVKANSDLTKYRIYDEITIIGLVNNIINEKETTIINLVDTVLINSDIYNDYSFEVITNDTENIKEFVLDKKYYLYGIDNIYVKYSPDAIYELSYTINDNRLTIDDLIKDKEEKIIKNDDEKEVAATYKLDKFNIYKCLESNITYFSKPSIKFTEDICIVEEIEEN